MVGHVGHSKLHKKNHEYGRSDALVPANIGQYGVASLDSGGKVPTSALPDAIVGAMKYIGIWDASGGVFPTVPTPAKGDYYVISIAGTMGGVDYEIGDWLVCNNATGPVWAKIDNSDKVSSVNGKTGPVSLIPSDIGAEPTISPKGSAFNKDFGTSAGQVCQGNDARLSDNRTDANAIHKATASEIHGITAKGSPVANDELLIEDSGDSYNKKRVLLSNLPGGVDTTAIHKATAGEIAAMTAKTILTGNDLLVLEDSADSNNKKKVTITNLLKRLTSSQVGPAGGISSGSGTFGYQFVVNRIMISHVGTGTNQDGYARYQFSCPVDCDAITNVKVVSRMDGAVDSFDFTLSKEGVNDANMNAVNILPGSDTTLTTYNFTPASTHTAGDVLLLDFRSTVDTAEIAQVAECVITYRKKVVY
jgi:hypothetical protein